MLDSLLRLEDTDNNMQITIDDRGPKVSFSGRYLGQHANVLQVVTVGTATSSGFNRRDVRGTYMLSNLLQELTLARDHGRKYVILDEQRLNENPVSRLSRLIKVSYWNALTRRLDGSNIGVVGRDPKDWTGHPVPRIYVPADCPEQLDYYAHVAASKPELELEVITLPSAQDITPEFVRDLNNRPGILALAMHEKEEDGKRTLEGVSYVVPGGRFNELYGWDGYMESIGLMLSGRVDLARGMIENYVFCIQHYGKILNANRSYYLCRSQPPFLTDMTFKVADALAKEAAKKEDSSAATAAAADATNFFRIAILAAIKEYYSVWTALPRLDLVSGLSRYRPDGIGIPPETEPMHFFHLLMPRARARGLNMQQFAEGYNSGALKDQELDEYFLHDRAVRESGHDTSYRLERVAADLATVDLNSLLYKYETDIATAIRDRFGGSLRVPVEFQVSDKVNPAAAGHEEETAVTWEARAAARKSAMDRLMWDETAGMYFDYNTVTRKHTGYESATTFWTMWSGVASNAQAARLVSDALPRFRALGGLVAGTEASRGAVGLDRPSRQWDYPYGWAPQQILAWGGLARYGYTNEAAELAYRWLYMVIKAFVDFNGTVVEKYDVTRGVDPHRVDAEYGNQGSDFRGVSREG